MFELNRRLFVLSAASALFAPQVSSASQFVLRAEPSRLQILPEGEAVTALLGFNGSTPGPELRVPKGKEVAVRFENALDIPTAVHWHGIRLNNAMDGVPGLTQRLVQPGESFDYVFTPPDAGTFWYHAHHQSWEQVAKGLYGPLIVEDEANPDLDHDITVVLDDWRINEAGELMGGFGNMHDFAHAGRLGNNAMVLPSRNTVKLGDRVRIRIINTATARVFPLRLEGLKGRIVAFDGMALGTPRAFEDLQIAPAQRVDLIGHVTSKVSFLFVGRDALYDLGSLDIDGDNPNRKSSPIAPLNETHAHTPSRKPSQSLTLRMEGGAMGGGHTGSDIWAFNGTSGMPEKPWATFRKGESAEIDLVNDTSFPHGIHLHGHHFFELKEDGSLGDRRDTTLVPRGASQKIAVVFDNPGKWLLHCHMLGHQASGMKTWVDVI